MEYINSSPPQTGLVSVIMNCYNSDRFLKNAIDSVLMQSYSDFEIIFWDNRSTDSSAQIVHGYTDMRIRYFLADRHTKLGEARMRAMECAKGEFVAFLDCDDEWLQSKLQIQVDLMRSNDVGYCYAGNIRENEEGQVLGKFTPMEKQGFLFSSLCENFTIDMLTPIIRRSVLKNLNINFNPNIYAAEEVNLFLRLAIRSKGVSMGCVLGRSRLTKSSLTARTAQYWHQDIDNTITQLRLENPDVDSVYPTEMRYLEFKSLYLKLKWLMSEGKHTEAQQEIANRPYYDLRIYWYLRCLCQAPLLWRMAHNFLNHFVNFRVASFFRRVASR